MFLFCVGQPSGQLGILSGFRLAFRAGSFLRSTELVDCLVQGCQTIFTEGHLSLAVTFKGPDVTFGLYTCNYSLTVK